MAPLKLPMGFKLHHSFSAITNPSSNNLTSKDIPCHCNSGNPTNPFVHQDTSYASLPLNISKPPPTIVTFIASLCLKGKGLIVDEPPPVDITKVPNEPIVTQPKTKKKVY
jgi:hypothetical protein